MKGAFLCLALSAVLLAACGAFRGPPPEGTRLIAIGDSILDWNRRAGADIPTLVSQRTGLPVFNAAISGAEFVGRFAIPDQYPQGDWDWLLLDGGGNDLTGNCGSPAAAEAVLDRLIDDQDLSGAYASFLAPVRSSGIQVIIMGYAPVSVAGGPFAPCEFALNDLRGRQAALAASDPMITFVDVRDVIAPDNLAAYDPDLIHPSPAGGALMADLIARAIENAR